MKKCGFAGKCFNDLSIDEKVKFFTKLSEKWTKADPKKFMTDKEQDQLDAITVEGELAQDNDTDSDDTSDEDGE